MLQYLLLSSTEPRPFITISFITKWSSPFSHECDLVNANNQLSAFVSRPQRHCSPLPSCFYATGPKQMNVCTVLTAHTVPRIEAGGWGGGGNRSIVFFYSIFCGMQVGRTGKVSALCRQVELCWGTGFFRGFFWEGGRSCASARCFVFSLLSWFEGSTLVFTAGPPLWNDRTVLKRSIIRATLTGRDGWTFRTS